MSGPYCETCRHFRALPFGGAQCDDPTKIIYHGKGYRWNSEPGVTPSSTTCSNWTAIGERIPLKIEYTVAVMGDERMILRGSKEACEAAAKAFARCRDAEARLAACEKEIEVLRATLEWRNGRFKALALATMPAWPVDVSTPSTPDAPEPSSSSPA